LVQGNNCSIENITIKNTAGRIGQAVALHVEGDKFTATNCTILGNQDTLYVATTNSQQYYYNCTIEGTTDFIFGEATVLFEYCTIKSLSNSFITAAATSSQQKYGFVFLQCNLIAADNVTKVYLGRPWRPFAKTVFIQCTLGKHITPEGWNEWKGDAMFPDKEKTIYYAEYNNIGEGAIIKNRVTWSKQLTKKESKKYTFNHILTKWKKE
jgi:pectinesterase